jgi:hypothetical protein
MKLKKLIIATLAISSLLITSEGCKKGALRKETGQISEDNKKVQSNIDASVNDANIVLSKNNMMSGKNESTDAILGDVCGAAIDSTQSDQGILTLIFDGTTNCNGHIRDGKIKLTLEDYANGKRWSHTGAILKLDYMNYKVTRVSDNANVMFNGTVDVKNTSGGNAVLLILGFKSQLVHDVSGNNINVKFEDGSASIFNLSRKYTHTYSASVYQVVGEGTGTKNGISQLENWGTTRDGDEFTSQVTEAVVWNNTCGAHKATKGVLDIRVDAKQFKIVTTLGVNASGDPVTSGCPWGIKVEWEYKNKSGKKMYPYN